MNKFVFITLFLFSAACRDDAVTAFNANPEATITSHLDDESFLDGYAVTFRGSVSDPDDESASLSVRWYVGTEVACDSMTPAVDGIVECAITLTEENTQVTLEVLDPDNAAGTASISFSVLPTSTPEVVITLPEFSGNFYADQLISFEGSATDEEDEASTLDMWWESSLDGILDVDADPNKDGWVVGLGYLSAGEQVVTLNAMDASGKTGTDSVTINVGTANAIPSCAITAPSNGDAGSEGALVIFEATVADDDIASNLLTLDWSSDKDGTLGSSTADSSGFASFAWSDLSVNTHTVSLNVTDDAGALCTANVIYSVGQPPSVTITSLTTGDVFTVGDNVIFAATVSDNEDAATALSIEWSSNLDGVLSTSAANSSGEASFTNNSLQNGLHTVTIKVTDTDSLYAVETVQITLNDAPTIDSVTITPATGVTVESTLACVATATDIEDGALSPIGYTWENTSTAAPLGVGSGLTLTSKIASSSNTITCEATFEDSDGATVTGSATVVIGNSAPSIADVTISPDPAYAGDVLSCSYTGFSDADGDTDVSTLEWFVNSVSAGNSTTLSAGLIEGAVVECVVTPSDGTDTGTAVVASISIGNTPPVLSSVSLTPDPAFETDTLNCIPGTATDSDGAASLTFGYLWTVNGAVQATTTTTLDGTSFDKGDDVTCVVTPNDGISDGAAVTSNVVTINNSTPAVSAAIISPNPATVVDTLVCSASGFTDADGDTDQSNMAWTVNGASAGVDATLVGGFSGGDSVTCTITPYDGEESGTSVSAMVVIDNSAPYITGVSISPNPAFTEDILICSTIGFYDADGDAEQAEYAWSVAGVTVGTGDTLASGFGYGDTVVCSATPFDGVDYGMTMDASISIGNNPPVLASVSLSPSPAYEGDVLTCSPGATTDPDGTFIFTYSYLWAVNGGVIGETSETLSSADFDKNDDVSCSVTPNDGTGDGAAVTSNVVTISNSLPSVSSVSLSPAGPSVGDTLTCLYTGWADADGDVDQSTLSWTIDGVVVGTSATLSGVFSGGDEVTCTVTPYDGQDTGTSRSVSVTVINNAPTLATVTISPDPATAADTLNCSYSGYYDIDGDADASIINWTIGGTVVGTGPTLAGSFSSGDNVVCTVTPSDGTDAGTPVSDSVTISNSPPVILSVTVTPDPAYEADTVACTPGTTTDADGTFSGTYSYAWSISGVGIASTSPALTGSDFDKGDLLVCTVTASDGLESSTPVSSSPVTVSNTLPSISAVSISPNPASDTDTLTCSWSGWSDADGDADSSTPSWTVNGTAAGAGATLSSGFVSADTVVCTVSPYDGEEYGSAVSASLDIEADNAAPVVSSLVVSPANVYTDTLVSAAVTATDAEGDTITLTYDWYVDGGLVASGVDLTSLAGTAYFDKGQEVWVEVTPNDGYRDGATVSSGTIVVLNTAPYAPSVATSPAIAVAEVDDLLCSVVVDSHDLDADTITYSITWERDGTAWAGSVYTTTYTGDTISAVDTTPGDQWVCFVTPNDGTESGTVATADVNVISDQPHERWPGLTYVLDDTYDFHIEGANGGGQTGYYVSQAGDVDGDGLPDIMVSSPYIDDWGYDQGMVSLYFGSSIESTIASGVHEASPYSDGPDWVFRGNDSSDYLGRGISSAGDVDGDGLGDILISQPSDDDASTNAGKVFLLFGKYLAGATGEVNLEVYHSDYGVEILGQDNSDWLGDYEGVSAVGDIDGDGLGEILIGAGYDDTKGTDAGEVYLLFGADLLNDHEYGDSILNLDSEYGYKFTAHDSYDHLGFSVASSNDVDGDGLPDLVMGAPGFAADYGAVYIVSSSTIWMNTLFGFTNDLWMGDSYDYRITSDTWGHFGYSIDSSGDFDGDGINDLLVGQHGNSEMATNGGAAYLFSGGALNWGDNDLSDAAFKFVYNGDSLDYDEIGYSVSFAGDVDGDGLSDILIGAPYDDDWANNAGKAYLVLGKSLVAPGSEFDLAFADYTFVCADDSCEAGRSVSGAGDIDQDGLDDIIIGAPLNDINGTNDGSAYVIFGEQLAARGGDLNLDQSDWVVLGQEDHDLLGGTIASAGDVDGDGLEDLLIGSHENDTNGDRSGEVYLVLGSQVEASWPDGGVIGADDNQRFYGSAALDYAGYDVDSAGDIDGDGLDDLLIGAPFNSDGPSLGGQVYLVLASSLDVNGGDLDLSADLSMSDYTFLPESPFDYVGWSVAGLGDIDGDNMPDIAIGAPFDDDGGTNAGAVYLFLNSNLPAGGAELDVADADYKLIGEAALDESGYIVTSAGDVDGDNLNDILILSASNDAGATDAGKAYLVLAADLPVGGGTVSLSSAHFSFASEAPNGGDYMSIAAAGDVDGDSLDDLLFGVPYMGTTYAESGRSYLVLGNSMVTSDDISLEVADYLFDGRSAYDYAGYAVSSAGDIDGDGLDDIMIGAPGNDEWGGSAGKAYLYFGATLLDLPVNPVPFVDDNLDRSYDYGFVGSTDNEGLGSAVLAADVNGDGFPDPILGGFEYATDRGRVYIKHNTGL